MDENSPHQSIPSADLLQELDNVRQLLEFYADPNYASLPYPKLPPPTVSGPPSRFERLTTTFKLSPFERMLLLLCLSVEFDPITPWLCARALGELGETLPSINLTFQLLGHCPLEGRTPDLAIYEWRLVTIHLMQPIFQAPISINPWVKQYLLGGDNTDPIYSGALLPQALNRYPSYIPPTHQKFTETLLSAWSEFEGLPVTQLIGQDPEALKMVVALALDQSKYRPYLIRGHHLPVDGVYVSEWVISWRRQAVLDNLVLVIDCGDPMTLPRAMYQLVCELLDFDPPPPVLLLGSEQFPDTINLVTYCLPNL
jgi:hypothetical protein